MSVRMAGRTVLDRVSLTIPAGSHVAIVGRSGAGKSTLVGLLLGRHRADSGRVTADGAALAGVALERLRQDTAWVDPSVHLWNRSLLENLRYGSRASDPSEIGGIIGEAQLSRVLEALPEGLQTPLGEGDGLVSGGEGQRVRL